MPPKWIKNLLPSSSKNNNTTTTDSEMSQPTASSTHSSLPPSTTPDQVAGALEQVVSNTEIRTQEPLLPGSLELTHHAIKHPWFQKLIPGIENLESSMHVGNFVMTRDDPPKKIWESMPIYVRIGMHLLFYGKAEEKLLKNGKIEALLKAQSVKQGQLFNKTEGSQEQILEFVKTYDLQPTLSDLLQPNLNEYKCFNEFFSRKLKPGARPVDSAEDWKVVTSAADCRLTVWEGLKEAETFWIKGKNFSLANLICDESITSLPQFANGAALAIFRLAPADYHRFHSPVTGTLGKRESIDGQFYTVNPSVINENFDVFTANRRDVQVIEMENVGKVVFVAIGALLVGSISWAKGEGEVTTKGEELGWFSYGSTVIAVFPAGSVVWDEDLLKNSHNKLETMVRVGQHIGTFKDV